MPSPAVYRRRRQVFFGGVAIVLSFLLYMLVTGLAPLPTAVGSLAPVADLTSPQAQLALPSVGANALSADGYGSLGTSGTQDQLPMASIAKTITALVILEAKPLNSADDQGPNITFTEDDVAILNQTQAEMGSYEVVTAGMVLTEKQALTTMMLASANNYAVSLANWAYGSVDKYVEAANAWAQAHHLAATHISDPAGIDAGTSASPADLISIGEMAMSNDALASIVGTKVADIPGVGEVSNGNKLLGHNGVNGIKTGTTTEAGACLLYSSVVPVGNSFVHLTGVSLGFDSHAELRDSVGALLMSAQAGFHEVPIVTEGQEWGTVTTSWGQTSSIKAASSLTDVVWSNTAVSVTPSLHEFSTGEAGAVIGKLVVVIGETTQEIPLVLESALSDPGLGWRMSHAGELF